ncbi:MAG: UDP-glucose/GDP-mannose dehydrogenase family protein [Bacteroidales bacterium]|nr:MAG: UDP-glucose/GDP-mannose dehydrogenase family protein [Bacteroidales bacterium]
MKITIIGTGYVGLVSGACFSETGITVSCVDISKEKIETLKKGIIPIYEPGLEAIVKRNLEKERLTFTIDLEEGMKESEAVFIAVGTPPGEDGSADLKHVLSVAENIGKLIKEYVVIVTKSTVPIGTSVKVKETVNAELVKRGLQVPFDIASNPEFLKEGAAVDDFLRPDRIIVGIESGRARKIMEKLYKPFLLNGHPMIFMDIASAELTKYAANSMLATRISFMNDIANICELVGADVNSVRKGIGSDPRIGNKFIYPGIGYGGSCFPKDIKAIIKTADSYGYPLKVIKAVEEVNNHQKEVIFMKIMEYFKEDLSGRQFGVWGLSFKPNTDDIREAPSLTLINKLLDEGAKVKAYDPAAMHEVKKLLGNKIEYSKDLYEAAIDIDALILVTEWSEFRIPNYKVLGKLMKQKIIFDGRNIYEPEELKELGFKYFCIGRKTIN